MPKYFLLTVDVEDWFQVENFKPWISYDSWPERELRVEKNTHRLLDLLDEAGARQKDSTNGTTEWGRSSSSIEATFFVLGWVAERLPGLVREIQERGHEVASHGYDHRLASGQAPQDFKNDLIRSKKILEDITGFSVYGYRAPSFSIDDDSLKSIEECGYLYDSSFNSFGMHGRYGKISLGEHNMPGIARTVSEKFYEIPISNLTICNRIFPLGGGAYFRILPFLLFKMGVKRILKKENAYMFYLHPWELDPEQPRVDEATRGFKFRHYANLENNFTELSRLFRVFSDCRFVSCHQYLEDMGRACQGETIAQQCVHADSSR